MSLTRWLENGWLVPHEATAAQVAQLLAIAGRDLAVADEVDDLDWKFGIAYNAVLKLCTVALNASGFRPSREMHHYRTLLALPLILGPDRQDDTAYLDQCRMKRNRVEYEAAGSVSQAEAAELLEFARKLRGDLLEWLAKQRPDLVPPAREHGR